MNRLFLILLLLAFFANPALAFKDRNEDGTAGQPKLLNMPMSETVNLNQVQEQFNDSLSDANYKEYTYAPDLTMKLRLREYMNTTVVLPINEAIRACSLGDEANFSFSPVKLAEEAPTNVFEVWGKYPGADTSLKVYGASGHIYVFYLRIDSIQSKSDPTLVCYVHDAALDRPQPIPASEAQQAQEAVQGSPYAPKEQSNRDKPDYLSQLEDVPASKLNFNYEVADPDSDLAPLRIFDDGYVTYIQFGEKNLNKVRDLPVLYRVVNGYDEPYTNIQKEGGFVIAMTVNDRWTLRSGDKWVCIRVEK